MYYSFLPWICHITLCSSDTVDFTSCFHSCVLWSQWECAIGTGTSLCLQSYMLLSVSSCFVFHIIFLQCAIHRILKLHGRFWSSRMVCEWKWNVSKLWSVFPETQTHAPTYHHLSPCIPLGNLTLKPICVGKTPHNYIWRSFVLPAGFSSLSEWCML